MSNLGNHNINRNPKNEFKDKIPQNQDHCLKDTKEVDSWFHAISIFFVSMSVFHKQALQDEKNIILIVFIPSHIL